MNKSPPSAKGKMWLATCATCKALCDTVEIFLVLALASIVACLAYVITLDEIPCPDFILRQIETKLDLNGISMRLDALHINADGQILIDTPTIYSNDLKAPIGTADLALIKISLPLLVFGQVQIEKIGISNGTLVAPPMLSSSGVIEKLVHGIDFEIGNHAGEWTVEYARLKYANLQAFISGELGGNLFKSDDQGGKPGPSLNQTILKIIPLLSKNQQHSQFAQSASADIRLFSATQDTLGATMRLSAEGLDYQQKHRAANASLTIDMVQDGPLSLTAKLSGVETLENIDVSDIELSAEWPQLPTKSNWHPQKAHLVASTLSRDSMTVAPSLLVKAHSQTVDTLQASVSLELADRSIGGQTTINPATQNGTATFSGLVGKDLPQLANLFVPQDLSKLAIFETPPSFELTAHFDSFKKRPDLTARFETGYLESRGAIFDRTKGTASIIGPQIRVDDIWISSRQQTGQIDIAYNFETRVRRFLLEGFFDPTNLNGWFQHQPWWAEFWDNFQFPTEGVYGLMDSVGIFLQPESIRVTGLGVGKNLGIRDYPMESLWLKHNIYSRHFDIYDIDLVRKKGSVNGDVRIEIGRDPKDQKDKLTALWVDATSSIDLSIAPDILYEVRDATADIIEPYQYEAPPTVTAQSTSIMENGIFSNNIDLVIDTDHPMTAFDFPFENVVSNVHVDDDLISIRNGRGGIGGGLLSLEADIVDDVITLESTLEKADFGKTLYAAATYFEVKDAEELAAAQSNSSSEVQAAEEDDFDKNELLEYGGLLTANFTGKGIVGDSLSYEGDGRFQIEEANLKKLQMFGLLSSALENTPLRFTTLKFEQAEGAFIAKKRFIEFPDPVISGPIALIKSSGQYDLDLDQLDFKAKLFPFRKSSFPVTAIIGLALQPLSHVLEVQLGGSLKNPKWSVFKQSQANTRPTSSSSSPSP